MSQLPLFFEEADEQTRGEAPTRGPGIARTEIQHRAGTKLDHRWTHKIVIDGKPMGLYDESQRVYQSGGRLADFVNWKRKLVSTRLELWRRIGSVADWIEMVDHDRNECWRIATQKFLKNAVRYVAADGDRIGCPMELWTVVHSNGEIKQEGA